MNRVAIFPGKYLPLPTTHAYRLFSILCDGLPHRKTELMNTLNDDPRSALQSLRGPTHGFWLIHNIGRPKGVYQLDSRHLSGDRDLDLQARIERELQYLAESRAKAQSEQRRLPNAIRAEIQAQERIQQSFEFCQPKEKSPLQFGQSKQA